MSDLIFDIAVQATVAAAIKEFVDLNKELDSLKNSLTATLGSSEAAGSALEHIAGLAERTGQGVMELTRQYSLMAAAAKGTALEGAGLYDTFDTVSASMGALGKSSAETERAFTALTQMLGKGTVQAEEWRGQLGEAMPNANAALQKATGLTTAEINKLIESGHLMASDMIPALTLGLKQMGVDSTKQVDTLSASLTRLKNASIAAFTGIGNAGATDVLKANVDHLTLLLRTLEAGASDASSAVKPLFEQIAKANDTFNPAKTAIQYLTNALEGYVKAHEPAKAATSATAEALQRAAAAYVTNAAKAAEATDAAETHAKAVKEQANAANAAADAAVQLARISGDEAQQLKAQADASSVAAQSARDLAAAQKARVDAEQKSIDLLAASIAERATLMKANGEEADAIQKLVNEKTAELAKRDQAIVAMRSEAEAMASNAQSQSYAAEQAKLAAQLYGDQSAQLKELTGRYHDAKDALQRIVDVQNDGKSAAAQLAAAQEKLKTATEAYNRATSAGLQGNENLARAQADLRSAMERSQSVVDQLKERVQAGKDADAKAAAAKLGVAEAQRKMTDAQQDSISALTNETTLRQLHLKILQGSAEQIGAANAAQSYGNQITQISIDGLQKLIAADELELAQLEKSLPIKIAEAEASGKSADEIAAERAEIEKKIAAKAQELIQLQTEIGLKQKKVSNDTAGANDYAVAAGGASSANEQWIASSQGVEQANTQTSYSTNQVTGGLDILVTKYDDLGAGAQAAAKWMADMMAEAKASIAQYSEEAAAAVDSVLSGVHSLEENVHNLEKIDVAQFVNASSVDDAKAKLAELKDGLEATREKAEAFLTASRDASNLFSGMDEELAAVYRFQERLIGAQIAAQKLAVAEEEAGAALTTLQDAYDQGDMGLADYIDKLTRLRSQYGNLTDEQIPDLVSALKDAKESMTDFASSAKSDLQDLQSEWADLNGQKLIELDLEEQQKRAEIELDLLQAKKDKNTEAIAYLNQELALLDQIYSKKKADQAAEDAAAKIKAAEDAAAEAERRANLTAEERAYEDKISALKSKLADAIAKADAQAQAAILAQIEAEKTRHQQYLDNLEKEKQKEKEKQDQQKASQDNVVGIGGGSKSAAADASSGVVGQRTVVMNLVGPNGNKASVNVLPGQADTLEQFLSGIAAAKVTAQ